jgi:hypothetical protein
LGANTHDDDGRRLHYFKILKIPGTFNIGKPSTLLDPWMPITLILHRSIKTYKRMFVINVPELGLGDK